MGFVGTIHKWARRRNELLPGAEPGALTEGYPSSLLHQVTPRGTSAMVEIIIDIGAAGILPALHAEDRCACIANSHHCMPWQLAWLRSKDNLVSQ